MGFRDPQITIENDRDRITPSTISNMQSLILLGESPNSENNRCFDKSCANNLGTNKFSIATSNMKLCFTRH